MDLTADGTVMPPRLGLRLKHSTSPVWSVRRPPGVARNTPPAQCGVFGAHPAWPETLHQPSVECSAPTRRGPKHSTSPVRRVSGRSGRSVVLVVVTRASARATVRRPEPDVADRHRPAEVQYPELGEDCQPVDEAVEHHGAGAQQRLEIVAGRRAGRHVLHQRQAGDRHHVARGGDGSVAETGDRADVAALEAPPNGEELAGLAEPGRLADRRVGEETAIEERAEHARRIECYGGVGDGEVEDLILVVHGATYSGLTASIPPLHAAGCTVTTSQKFSGAMIGNSGGPHSRYAEGTEVSKTLSSRVIAMGDHPHALVWVTDGIGGRRTDRIDQELAVVAQGRDLVVLVIMVDIDRDRVIRHGVIVTRASRRSPSPDRRPGD